MKRTSVLAIVCGLGLPVTGLAASNSLAQECVKASAAAQPGTIVEVAQGAGTFNTLVAAVKAADLTSVLSGEGPFTVFAPSDEAFAKLPKGTLEELLKPANKAKLAAILTYHVVPGRVLAADVKTGAVVTANGQRVDLKVDKKKVTIDGANIVATDIHAANGVIHVIDRVILPSDKNLVKTALADGRFKTLASLIEKAGLADALSGKDAFTVFAPTDEAFAKLPQATLDMLAKPENADKLRAILKYHVVPGRVFSGAVVAADWKGDTLQGSHLTSKVSGGTVTVGTATVVATDVDASNGVIHVIDSVLLPE